MSRSLRVTDPNFDHQGFQKIYAQDHKNWLATKFGPYAQAIDFAGTQQKWATEKFNPEHYPAVEKALDSAWNPNWAYLSLFGIVSPLHRAVMRNDSKNFIHPFFRRVALPFAATTMAFSAWNQRQLTLDAHYDKRTANYQATANLTWQALNNVILPAALLRLFSRPLKVQVAGSNVSRLAALGIKPQSIFQIPTWRTYAAAVGAIAIATLVGNYTKFEIEGYFVRRRFGRKDYGSGSHSLETTSLEYDQFFSEEETAFNTQGDEYIINPTNERVYAELFPYFSLAEAVATHEVPINAHEYQHHSPLPFQASLLQGTLDLSGKPGRVPVQSPSTFMRNDNVFGEWKLATPFQLAADQQFLGNSEGKKALVNIFKETTPRLKRNNVIKPNEVPNKPVETVTE